MSNGITYEELERCKASPTKTIVISACSKGGFTIAQQFDIVVDGEVTSVFLKGAFHINGRQELIDFIDALQRSVDKFDANCKLEEEDSIHWDE